MRLEIDSFVQTHELETECAYTDIWYNIAYTDQILNKKKHILIFILLKLHTEFILAIESRHTFFLKSKHFPFTFNLIFISIILSYTYIFKTIVYIMHGHSSPRNMYLHVSMFNCGKTTQTRSSVFPWQRFLLWPLCDFMSLCITTQSKHTVWPPHDILNVKTIVCRINCIFTGEIDRQLQTFYQILTERNFNEVLN